MEKDQLKSNLAQTSELLASQQTEGGEQRKANETQITEIMERIRGKDMVID